MTRFLETVAIIFAASMVGVIGSQVHNGYCASRFAYTGYTTLQAEIICGDSFAQREVDKARESIRRGIPTL